MPGNTMTPPRPDDVDDDDDAFLADHSDEDTGAPAGARGRHKWDAETMLPFMRLTRSLRSIGCAAEALRDSAEN